MYHIFFIHSSVDGHLGCFRVLAVVKSAAMTIVVAVVQWLSWIWFFVTPRTAACQASLSFTVSGVCSNSCPLSLWCSLTISSSLVPFSSCPQSFPASGPFPMSQLFKSGGESIGASAPVLPMNIQGWFPLGLTGLISLQFKGLSRVFSSTKVQKHQFLGAFIFLNYDILERGSPFFPQMKSLPGDMRAWSLVLGDALSLALLVVITG